MKKLFVLGALALATLSMSAQGYEGKWFVGGTYGFTSKNSSVLKTNSDKYEKHTTFDVSPLVGYFIAPTLAVGGQVGFTGGKDYKTADGITGKVTNSSFYIAPLVRKYFPLGDSGFNFFGQLQLPVEFGNVKNKAVVGGKELNKTTEFNVNVRASIGFDYIINEKYSFETSMNLASIGINSTKEKDAKRATDFNANINPGEEVGSFKVGFKMLF